MLTIIVSTIYLISTVSGSYYGSRMVSDDSAETNIICPFITQGTPPSQEDLSVPDLDTYNEALLTLDINDVFQDIVDLLTDSQDCWPADTLGGQTNYGGLFIRLAWHCAGTFRDTDGAGGCAGGRQRFPPEASWDDNTQLDKARALLYPIKKKYGDALSWGDLFVFAGTASIYALGGPVSQICAGRIDEPDGSASDVLGFNNDIASAVPPCTDQGDCNEDNDIIGASTVGLIYVNPQGVNGVPDPVASAARVREIFSRMGNNDSETVALIGGGHAFGKCHGACPLGAGPNPEEQPFNPWPGACGFNFPEDAFTSGIEGQWTTYPFVWDNEYFTQLVDDGFDYILETGPGGAYQWRNPKNGNLMLTTDLAFIYDDDFYQIVKNYAADLDALDRQFEAVWFKLVTRDGGFADEGFCISAQELDLDLSEINPRGRGRGKGGKYGYGGGKQKRDDDCGRHGVDYVKKRKRGGNDDGRGSGRSGGRDDDQRSGSWGKNDDGRGGNDDGRKGNDYGRSGSSTKKGYSAQNEPGTVISEPNNQVNFWNSYGAYILIAIITIVFNLIAYGATYMCYMNKTKEKIVTKY